MDTIQKADFYNESLSGIFHHTDQRDWKILIHNGYVLNPNTLNNPLPTICWYFQGDRRNINLLDLYHKFNSSQRSYWKKVGEYKK